jgi:hypothetical protein
MTQPRTPSRSPERPSTPEAAQLTTPQNTPTKPPTPISTPIRHSAVATVDPAASGMSRENQQPSEHDIAVSSADQPAAELEGDQDEDQLISPVPATEPTAPDRAHHTSHINTAQQSSRPYSTPKSDRIHATRHSNHIYTSHGSGTHFDRARN